MIKKGAGLYKMTCTFYCVRYFRKNLFIVAILVKGIAFDDFINAQIKCPLNDEVDKI